MSHLLAKSDARRIPLPDGSVQCCVTSPPYFGLRDYQADRQIGLEATPDAYVATMVAVFREVRRVLRSDGCLWLNLGDSYAHSLRQSGSEHAGEKQNTSTGSIRQGFKACPQGLKEKDLIGIPWRVAFAQQADGWYLRSDIIWAKPNPMPESVTDRPTKAHEYLFLLAKNERYYYDADAVREPGQDWGQRDRSASKHNTEVYRDAGQSPHRGLTNGDSSAGRNIRSVWTVPTHPYAGAHFATMPPKLVAPCIKAGSKPGDIVFDPFNGSGTTGSVATGLGRRYVGFDLNPEYLDMAARRISRPHAPVRKVDKPMPLFGDAS